MKMIDPFLMEFTQEMGNTRKLLERVPEARFAWKPHEKSMSLGQLASHLAETPQWAVPTIGEDEFDMDPSAYKPWLARSRAELLAKFDESVAAAKTALGGAKDESLTQRWAFKTSGKVIFEMPRMAVLRSMILNHLIHHRGQLTVYLRLNDVPLPPLYGPTADER